MIHVHYGGGSGGTLTVSSVNAGWVTAANAALGKSYTKIINADSSVTFKGLGSGTWTVTLSDGTNESSKTVEINADYETSIAYFAAYLTITYPAASTCTVTDPNGKTVATDSNETADAKSFELTVNAKGIYTVSSTNDDGDSDTETVEITTDGQTAAVELSYELLLFSDGVDYTEVTGGMTFVSGNYPAPTLTVTDGNLVYSQGNDVYGNAQQAFVGPMNALDLTDYSILEITIDSITDGIQRGIIGVSTAKSWSSISASSTTVTATAAGTYQLDISGVNGEYFAGWGLYTPTFGTVTCAFSEFKLIP